MQIVRPWLFTKIVLALAFPSLFFLRWMVGRWRARVSISEASSLGDFWPRDGRLLRPKAAAVCRGRWEELPGSDQKRL